MSNDDDRLWSGEALSAHTLRGELGEMSPATALHLYKSVESTSTFLLNSSDKSPVEICASEVQTQGRGRRGSPWLTPVQGVTFSIKLTVPVPLTKISGGSLVCGVSLCDTLRNLGVSRAAVKWPNDILIGKAKLAGILVEVAAHSQCSTTLVVGIGINYRLGQEQSKIEREIIDLYQLCDGEPPDRSQLIGKICQRVHADLSGSLPLMPSFIETWRNYDALAGQLVTVDTGVVGSAVSSSVAGYVAGIDQHGCLVLETADGSRSFSSAEVTIQKSVFDSKP